MKVFIFLCCCLTAHLASAQNRVGIGNSSPQQQLSVNEGLNIDQANQNAGINLTNGLRFGGFSGEGISSRRSGGNSIFTYGLDFYTNNTRRFTITNAGNVIVINKLGINQPNPGAALDINTATTGNYTISEDGNHALEIWDEGGANPNHSLYLGADATHQVGYIQAAATGGFRDLLLQGRGGNVLIGRDANSALAVHGDAYVDFSNVNNGTTANSLRLGGAGSGETIGSKRTSGGNQYGLDFYTNSQSRLQVTFSGVVKANNKEVLVTDMGGQRQKIVVIEANIGGAGILNGFQGSANTYAVNFSSKPIAWIAGFEAVSGEPGKMNLTTEVLNNGNNSWMVKLHATNISGGVISYNATWKIVLMGSY